MSATWDGVNPELKARAQGVCLESGGVVYLSEGFRTRAEQQIFWEKAKREHPENPRAWAAYPGTSKHERGEATDLKVDDPVRDRALRARLAQKWGLSAPLPNEPWHFELNPKRGPMPNVSIEDVNKTMTSAIAFKVTPSGKGYWIFTDKGGVYCFGDAAMYGGMAGKPLSRPIVDVTVLPSGKGYIMLGADGGLFPFGDEALTIVDAVRGTNNNPTNAVGMF